MDASKWKEKLPTFFGYWEKRRQAARNQLPKHLRPVPRWPIALQLLLNMGIIITLCTMMIEREEYLTEAGPAIVLVVCLLLLIYTVISAFKLRRRYAGIKGYRWARFNFWVTALAFLCWPAAIAVFLS